MAEGLPPVGDGDRAPRREAPVDDGPRVVSRAPGKPPADEAKRKRRIVSIDVAGDAAVAKVELDYPAVFFVDYLSLLRVDGEWKIAQKTYTGTSKKAP